MSVAANRYATALIDVLPSDQIEAGLQQQQTFLAFLTSQPDARRFLENPALAGERRNRLLKEMTSALGLDRRIANFISILANRNRLPLLEKITTEYERLMDSRLGIVRARVTAAQTLDAAQQQALAKKLQDITGKQIRMEIGVDPSLIGGVIAQVGSTVYDGSVRQRLEAFKTKLVGE